MAEKKEHLDLPSIEESFKKKSRRGGPLSIISRDYSEFSQTQIEKLDSIGQKYRSEKESMPDYSQELVFKIKTAQRVSDDQFRKQLKGAGIETLISKPGKTAEWIVTTQDPNFGKLKEKIIKRVEKEKSDVIDGIEKFDEIKFEDKIGDLLKEKPLGGIEVAKLNVSLTRKESDIDGEKLQSALTYIDGLVRNNGYQIYDKLNTKNLCMLLLECNSNLLQEIARLDLVTKIDRTPEFILEKIIAEGQEIDMNVNAPTPDANGILVMDSGIIRHPLLDPAIPNDGFSGLPDRPIDDDRNHGTMVSGNSLYGNLEPRISNDSFDAKFWIYSAKVFYQSGQQVIPDQNRLVTSIIKESFEDIKSRFPKCRVVNLSFGDKSKIMTEGKNQFELAVLIDELSGDHPDTIFVISMGNIMDPSIRREDFPEYLCDGRDDIKLFDPASSVHALSIGALQENSSELIPSDITRTGPGLNDMIKPELVEIGGGFHKNVVVLNPDFRQRTFTVNSGTSFSAPIIAYYLAELITKFSTSSRNMIKSLLIASSKYPNSIPESFPKLLSNISNDRFLQISNVYGYGKPNLENALMSDENRVVFKYEGSIKIDHVKYFEIKIPPEFVSEKGDRFISVSLVFDPPVRSSRSDYFGTRMEFHMFRNRTIEEIQEKYNDIDVSEEESDSDDGKVPEDLKGDEIKFKPSNNLRKETPHQKGVVKLTSRYEIDPSKPLTLAVLCQKKWKITKQQNFAIAVTMEHQKEIDLYNKIQALNVVRTRVRV